MCYCGNLHFVSSFCSQLQCTCHFDLPPFPKVSFLKLSTFSLNLLSNRSCVIVLRYFFWLLWIKELFSLWHRVIMMHGITIITHAHPHTHTNSTHTHTLHTHTHTPHYTHTHHTHTPTHTHTHTHTHIYIYIYIYIYILWSKNWCVETHVGHAVWNGAVIHQSDLPLQKYFMNLRVALASPMRGSLNKHFRNRCINSGFSNGSEWATVSFSRALLHRFNYQALTPN